MADKADWTKNVAIALAVIFFIFWIVGTTLNNNENELLQQKYDNLYAQCESSIQNSNTDFNSSVELLSTICKSSLQNLQNQWESSISNLRNCYKQGTPQCEYTTPSLNLTR